MNPTTLYITFSHRTQKLISVCFVYTRYEQCILISVANEHYYRKMNLNNLDLLLVHFLRNFGYESTKQHWFCTFVFTYLYMPKEGL